jgi:hypothetical protein
MTPAEIFRPTFCRVAGPRREGVIRDEQTQFSSGPRAQDGHTDAMRKRPDTIDTLIEAHLWLRAQEGKPRKYQNERTVTVRTAAKSPIKGRPRRTPR